MVAMGAYLGWSLLSGGKKETGGNKDEGQAGADQASPTGRP
jgi:hypothetical protein